jgi:hypothetical protein
MLAETVPKRIHPKKKSKEKTAAENRMLLFKGGKSLLRPHREKETSNVYLMVKLESVATNLGRMFLNAFWSSLSLVDVNS